VLSRRAKVLETSAPPGKGSLPAGALNAGILPRSLTDLPGSSRFPDRLPLPVALPEHDSTVYALNITEKEERLWRE
jgi:hypothetical protein